MSSLVALMGLQRVVVERPPQGSLQRGLLAVPRAPVIAAVLLAIVALGVSIARRRRSAR